MELIVILTVILLAHILIVVRLSWIALPVYYVVGTAIWFFYPGISSGFTGWIGTCLAVLGLGAIGSVMPRGAKGIAIAGVGGYLLGKKIAKM